MYQWHKVVLGRRPKTCPNALKTLAAFLGQTSQKFGRLRLEQKTGLSAELLEPARAQHSASEQHGRGPQQA